MERVDGLVEGDEKTRVIITASLVKVLFTSHSTWKGLYDSVHILWVIFEKKNYVEVNKGGHL